MATIAGQKNLNEDSYGKILLKPMSMNQLNHLKGRFYILVC
jgi:hypothetical protein